MKIVAAAVAKSHVMIFRRHVRVSNSTSAPADHPIAEAPAIPSVKQRQPRDLLETTTIGDDPGEVISARTAAMSGTSLLHILKHAIFQ